PSPTLLLSEKQSTTVACSSTLLIQKIGGPSRLFAGHCKTVVLQQLNSRGCLQKIQKPAGTFLVVRRLQDHRRLLQRRVLRLWNLHVPPFALHRRRQC